MRPLIKSRAKSQYNKYVLFMLMALEVLMSFTFLGYIHIQPISITYAYIPILVAGILLGPASATAVGAVFGLCSMYKASAHYVMAGDRIFSPVMSGAPLASVILSLGTRLLFGLIMGLMLQWAKERRHPAAAIGAAAVLSRGIHSAIVYACMSWLFAEQNADLLHRLFALPGLSDILLDAVCLVIAEAVWKLHRSPTAKKIREYMEVGGKTFRAGAWGGRRPMDIMLPLAAIVLVLSVSSAVYFAQRTSYMMNAHDIQLNYCVQYDLLHLQMQFLMAMLALSVIVWLLFMTIYRYMLYREYMGRLDELTGVMGRGMLRAYCLRRLKDNAGAAHKGCFLLVDLDYFKQVNDTLGHPAGDIVLRAVAECLQRSFEGVGRAGRMGGDEFSVFVDRAISKSDMQRLLDGFMADIAGALPEHGDITCSVGCLYFDYPAELERIYTDADKLLYEAKQRGRAQYVIGGAAN